jgi:hypothetical protein
MAAVTTSSATSHVFICFSSKDEAIARDVVRSLEEQGLACWISLRDVPPGQNYQETIVAAVESARGLVFLFSESSNESGEIKKELSLAAAANVPVFPLRLAPILPTGALRYELATRQWIDLFDNRTQALSKLASTISRSLSVHASDQAAHDLQSREAPSRRADPIQAAPPLPAPAKKRTRKRVPIVAVGSDEFEAVRALLARHIGPIAKVFVQKAASEAENLDAFCERLASHVPSPTDRASFLHAVRSCLTTTR